MKEEIVWREWSERFEGWKKFAEDYYGFAMGREWWLSRFNDDHPLLYGWEEDVIWAFIASALKIKTEPVQLHF